MQPLRKRKFCQFNKDQYCTATLLVRQWTKVDIEDRVKLDQGSYKSPLILFCSICSSNKPKHLNNLE